MRKFSKSHKLDHVCYDIRGPVLEKASEMVACAKRNGRVLAIGHQYHNFKNFRKLKNDRPAGSG